MGKFHWSAVGLLLASSAAFAQEQRAEIGAKPPVMSIRDVTKQQAAVAAASATDDAPAQRQMGVPGLTQPVPTPTAPPPAPSDGDGTRIHIP
jgi:hypothetical protein